MDEVEDHIKALVLSDSDDSDGYDEDRYTAVEDDNKTFISTAGSYHSNRQVVKENAYQPAKGLQHKYTNKITLDKYENAQDQLGKKADAGRIRLKDKGNRATVEQVFDKTTCMILFQMMERQTFSKIRGYISIGNKANVYFASDNGPAKAVKIYKTSNQKSQLTWAEKEFRNLLRIHKAGLPCPEPFVLKNNVLVMEFIGKNGVPAPLLKDTELSVEKYTNLYLDMVCLMKDLYVECKLVHADLSECKVLYHDDKAMLIDVSQSVEPDHRRAFKFLRKDCKNITHFFKKKGVEVVSVRHLFEFITNPNVVSDFSKYMEGLEKTPEDDPEFLEESKVDEEVFKQAYIPKRLDEVVDAERDIFVGNEEALYHTVTGLQPQNVDGTLNPELNETSSDHSSGEDSEADEKRKGFVNSRRPRDESPNSKKERKKALKDARKAKQKTKVPKHVKKRIEKLAHQNSKK